MNVSEIKDFNKFKQFFKEKYGTITLSMYTQGLNQQVPEGMEEIVRHINEEHDNEEHDKEERRKVYLELKQEFEPVKKNPSFGQRYTCQYNPKIISEPNNKELKVGDTVYVKGWNSFGIILKIEVSYWSKITLYNVDLGSKSCEFEREDLV